MNADDKVTELHRTGQAVGVVTYMVHGEVKALFIDYRLVTGRTGRMRCISYRKMSHLM